jgi:AbiV family abortive infection protein
MPLEQCGLLLRDANVLYRNGSYSSAVVLAKFASEALGQWKTLRSLRTEVLGGKRLTITDIQNACRDHERKQKAGALSTTIKANTNSELGRLIHARTPAEREQLEKVRRRKAKRIPSERHEQRMSALYVDPVPSGWNRPTREVTQSIAFDDFQDAANDYRGQYHRYTDLGTHKLDDPEFYTALEQWAERPTLPLPESP